MTVEQIAEKMGKLPLRIKSAFFSALIVGIMTHGYILTHKLSNSDDLMSIRAFGGEFSMGRWVTGGLGPVVSKFFGNYSNPWITGTLSLLLLAVAACFIVEALEIKRMASTMVVSAIMVCFPSITSTLLYGFVAAYFCLGILLASISVWILARYKKVYMFVLGVFLLSCSMGLYQAYFPFAASILLIILIKDCISDTNKTTRQIIFRALRFFLALLAGMLLYFAISVFCVFIFHETMSTHKNLDHMGQIDVTLIPGIVAQMYDNMMKMLTQGFMGMSSHVTIRCLIAVCWIADLVYTIYRFIWLAKKKQWVKIAGGYFFF